MEKTNIRPVPTAGARSPSDPPRSHLYARRLSSGYPPVLSLGVEDRTGTANP
jgi:hypothetical protein